ncbi:MAG: MFS transporter [Gammaproteobacteria bacterium]|nr:MFS transporter [Gammaproteobacteria bacterium]
MAGQADETGGARPDGVIGNHETPMGMDPGQTGALTALSWLHFLNDGAANFLPGILPLLLLSLHRSPALAGGLMAALLIGQGLQPVFGYWADRIGGRRLVMGGFLGTAIGMGLIGVSTGFVPLLAALALIGVANAAFHPPALAAARSLERASRSPGRSVSVFLVGGELGRGLSPWLVTLAAAGFGLDHLWLLSILSVASLVVLRRYIPVLPVSARHERPLQWHGKARPLGALVTFATLRSLVSYALVTFLPLLWRQQGGSVRTGALLIAVIIVAGIIGNLGGPVLARRFGRQPLLAGSLLLVAGLLAATLSAPWVFAWPLLAGVGIALFAPIAVTVVAGQDIFPENRSLGGGLALGSANGLAALAMIALGGCAKIFGLEATLWVTVGLAALAAGVAKSGGLTPAP